MKIKAKVTISCTQGFNDRSINIRVYDDASGIEFVDGHMTLADFASAITGLGHCEMEAEVRGLEYVGKQAIRETRSIEYTGVPTYQKEILQAWLKDQPHPGWLVNTYLGSQNSIIRRGDKTTLNYSVIKYVDMEKENGNLERTDDQS